jgi:magnesium transporter
MIIIDVIECQDVKINELSKLINLNQINWLNIHGLNDVEIIKSIGCFFGIDNFMISDILNTTKRTKIEEYHEILFFNIKSFCPLKIRIILKVEQISFLLKNGVSGFVSRKKK